MWRASVGRFLRRVARCLSQFLASSEEPSPPRLTSRWGHHVHLSTGIVCNEESALKNPPCLACPELDDESITLLQ